MTDNLISVAQIAEYLGLSTKHVQDRIVCQTKFPRPIRFPTTQGRSQPRWKREEVVGWVESYQERKQA